MNIDKNRFTNFAKYDLTINKTFFRNIALVTLAGAVGIAILGFMLRYNIYRDVAANTGQWITPPAPGDFSHYANNYITAFYELGFIALMMAIFAGCWAHNLRTKQGRITELTLPATNLEKFAWHALLMLVGGFALCILSLLVADGLNALLTLLMFGTEEGIGSLTYSAGQILTFNAPSTFSATSINVIEDMNPEDQAAFNMLHATSFLVIASVLCETLIFFFGNALKYKYNIILTYIALQVIGTVGSIIFFIFTAVTAGDAIDALVASEMGGEQALNYLTIGTVVLSCLIVLLSVLLLWWSYRRYTKAQITSPLNK